MVTANVKKTVTKDVTLTVSKWREALQDASTALDKAKKDVAQWKGTIAVIQRKIKSGAAWPGEQTAI